MPPAVANQLVFTITNDPHLGYVVEAYLVGLLDDNKFSYTYKKVNADFIANYDYAFTDEHIKTIKLCNQLSYEAINKQYNKKPIKVEDFLKSLHKDLTKRQLILDNIGTKVDKILLRLLGQTVYYKEKPSDHPALIAFNLLEEPAEVVYNFSKTPKETYYYLTIKHNGVYINLKKDKTIIINKLPCWVAISNNVYHFKDGTDADKLSPFLSKQFIKVDAKMNDTYFKTFVQKAVKNYEVHAQGFNILNLEYDNIKILLQLEEGLDGAIQFMLQFDVEGKLIPYNNKEDSFVEFINDNGSYTFKKFKREKAKEQAIINYLLSLGLAFKYGSSFELVEAKGIMAAMHWVAKYKNELLQNQISVSTTLGGKVYSTQEVSLLFNEVEQTNDWFDVNAVVKIGSFEIPFIRFRTNIINEIPEYILPDGSVVLLPQEWFEKYRTIFLLSQANGSKIRLSKAQSAMLDDILPKKAYGSQIQNLLNQNIQHAIPASLNATLRGYQAQGYNWLMGLNENQLGGCLADDMGLGKTIQIITLLLSVYKNIIVEKPKHLNVNLPSLKDEILDKPQLSLFDFEGVNTPLAKPNVVANESEIKVPSSLVILPVSLIHNWAAELRKFAPTLRVVIFTSLTKNKTIIPPYNAVILTTYGIVRTEIDYFKRYTFEYAIVDESQAIKNTTSQTFKAVKQLQANNRIALTGTPIENSLTDLWAQFEFINPGILGTFELFKKEFQLPIEKKGDVKASERLKKIIAPFILRRTKQQVAQDLPPLIEKIYYCEMDEAHKELYEREKSYYRNVLLGNIKTHGIAKSQMLILQGLMKLRLLANSPTLATANDTSHNLQLTDSIKFREATQTLQNLIAEGHKVLVFSQFVKQLLLYKNWLTEQDIAHSYLVGSTKNRAEEVANFETNESYKVFLISLKAGGVGLNLVSADYVLMLDPWWNPAAEAQAINRAHRIGQVNTVIAYKFIVKDTIEEKIYNLQQRKQNLADEFVNNVSGISLSADEISDLFS